MGKQQGRGVDIDPEKRFATMEEFTAWRYRQGQVVPEGHPAYEPWMADFDA